MRAVLSEQTGVEPRASSVGHPADSRRVTSGERWHRRLPLLPALIYVVILTQVPFVLTLWYSFQSWNLLSPGSKHFVGIANYKAIAANAAFRGAIAHSVEMTGISVVLAMAFGILLAVLLDRTFFGRGVVRTLLITPFLIMPVAADLFWKSGMFDASYGLVNWVLSPLGVSHVSWLSVHPMGSLIVELTWQWTPFMMLIVLAGLQSQPHDMLEAARVDGARWWSTFKELTVPHLRPYIELGILLGAIYVFNTFGDVDTMTQGGPGTATTNLPYFLYEQAFHAFNIGSAAAMGVVAVILTIIVAMFALRLLFSVFGLENSK